MAKSRNGVHGIIEAGVTSYGYRLSARLTAAGHVRVDLTRVSNSARTDRPDIITFSPRSLPTFSSNSSRGAKLGGLIPGVADKKIAFDPRTHSFGAVDLLPQLHAKAGRQGWTIGQLQQLERIAQIMACSPVNAPGAVGRWRLTINLGVHKETGYDLALVRSLVPRGPIKIIQKRKIHLDHIKGAPDIQQWDHKNGLQAFNEVPRVSVDEPFAHRRPTRTEPDLFLNVLGHRGDDLLSGAACLTRFSQDDLCAARVLLRSLDPASLSKR